MKELLKTYFSFLTFGLLNMFVAFCLFVCYSAYHAKSSGGKLVLMVIIVYLCMNVFRYFSSLFKEDLAWERGVVWYKVSSMKENKLYNASDIFMRLFIRWQILFLSIRYIFAKKRELSEEIVTLSAKRNYYEFSRFARQALWNLSEEEFIKLMKIIIEDYYQKSKTDPSQLDIQKEIDKIRNEKRMEDNPDKII